MIAFIERYCIVPEGKFVGKPIRLLDFQKQFIRAIYDNPHGTSRAYLSIARKNSKTTTIACIVLAHLVGPEARQNAQIVSGARSRDQAAIVFDLASKMIRLSPELSGLVRITPSSKTLTGLTMGTEYRAISAEAGTAHGKSPVVAILDEVGQVKGPKDAFVEAIETAQGAHENPLLIAISTQAASDGDLFSIWLDDAAKGDDKSIVSHVYAAPAGCDILDEDAWRAANPALGEFRSLEDLRQFAERASRMPASEGSFRWLFLNQRVEANSPFVSRAVWQACAGDNTIPPGSRVWGGLDLSSVNDLTALVLIAEVDGVTRVQSRFWLPEAGLRDRALRDRAPYDTWRDQGFLEAAPGQSVDYSFVAEHLRDVFETFDVQAIAFDRWNFKFLQSWLERTGFGPAQLERFVEFGQGFQSMSPALRTLEADLLNGRLAHGGHPVLTMCAANAVIKADEAGNRKLNKAKSSGRIDGMVALAMAIGVRGDTVEASDPLAPWEDPNFRLAV